MQALSINPEQLVDRLGMIMRSNLPFGVDEAYVDGFFRRHRRAMVQMVGIRFGAREIRPAPSAASPAAQSTHADAHIHRPFQLLPELWGPAERTRANLRAMQLLAEKHLEELTNDDRRAIARYSGWGGLSLKRVADQFPPEFPVPSSAGLVHEYYTPSMIADEVARVVLPLLAEHAEQVGPKLTVLEPSAGIGRFINAIKQAAHDYPELTLDWHAVEISPVSVALLRALYPDISVWGMPFEGWFANHAQVVGMGSKDSGADLIVANPPYGPRGASKVQDPDRAYRVKQAYIYFLLRGSELLRRGGVGVFLVPYGFLTAAKFSGHREHVLRRAHLLAAFRLPSESHSRRDPIFPGANLVTDLLLFEGRGGVAKELPVDDLGILDGEYFREYPENVLGEEVLGDDSPDARKFRRRYAIIGDFERLPEFELRPFQPMPLQLAVAGTSRASNRGVERITTDEDEGLVDLPPELDDAVKLGLRVDTFLAQVAQAQTEQAAQAWVELHQDLTAWSDNFGNPHQRAGLAELVRRGSIGAERFLGAFDRHGELVEALATAPVHEPVYRGEPDLLSQADWLYRQQGKLKVFTAASAHQELIGEGTSPMEVLITLLKAGWCVDARDWSQPVGRFWLIPASIYYTGDLWPKVDRCKAALSLELSALSQIEGKRAFGDNAFDDSLLKAQRSKLRAQLQHQLELLMAAIKPSVFEDIIDGLSPRETWLPVAVVNSWVNQTIAGKGWRHNSIQLYRDQGLLQIEGLDYEALTGGKKVIARLPVDEQTVWFMGWANHHLSIFRPPQPKEIIDGVPQRKPLDEVRLEIAAEWTKSFAEWLSGRDEAKQAVEEAYNRSLRGFVAPSYAGDPIHIARWTRDGPRLYEYQNQSARRLLANRGGLLAFDVGLGKTYTAIAVLARARQEGWARRPVIVVPNSIIWKWYRDIQRCLPDYRVLVIGSNRKEMTRGPRKGRIVAETDSPQERAEKWSAFQAGRADVVLLTYSALGRTRIDPAVLYDYVDDVTAIQRQIKLSRAKSKSGKKLSERDEAVLKETVEGWVAERLEAPASWEYDPGIEWHSLGIDWVCADEGQNFKNLFMPEEREGGLPAAMGGSVESKRAWQLDFRCASVRAHTGGSGVILLSATPAKNGPVEFYNAIHLIQPNAWKQVGISDPEAFIDRYCAFESKTAQTPDGKLTVRQTCTSFKNLHELRDVVFRYSDFQTAEDVGLKIPDAQNFEHRVDLNDDQVEAIRDAWKEIRDLREEMKQMHGEQAAKMREALRLKIMGIAMRVDLVAIHPQLPGASRLKAREILDIDPHSGKIDAVVEQILATDDTACDRDDPDWCLNCGHIVFVENIAVHYWLREALVEAGIPRHRIAILNAKDAKDPETRQQIAEQFNGVGRPEDEDHEPPKYDVVIANSVAYEGVDLQVRTCAVHHMDLPWEPATLQQRNGRGVRQGNKFERVKLHYYIGRPSGDGRRLVLISNKRSWMTSLVNSQDRVTNNPAATIDVSIEDILLDIVPADERERVLREREVEEKLRQEQLAQRTRIGANKLLSQANARFRRAEQLAGWGGKDSGNLAEAGRLREEGDAILADLAKIDSTAWPWLDLAREVRTRPLYVPPEGPPVWPGMQLKLAGRPVEIGVHGHNEEKKPVLGIRRRGAGVWRLEHDSVADAWLAAVTRDDFDIEDDAASVDQLTSSVRDELRWSTWPELGWAFAPDQWKEAWWPQLSSTIVDRLKQNAWRGVELPVVGGGMLQLVTDSLHGVTSAEVVLPPTESGWKRYLDLVATTELKWTELNNVARFWWGKTFPRGVARSLNTASGMTTESLRRYRRNERSRRSRR